MTISAAEQSFLDDVSLDMPWALVETFATMHRWMPEDVNTAADVIISRLRAAGDAARYRLTTEADRASFIEPMMRRKPGSAQ